MSQDHIQGVKSTIYDEVNYPRPEEESESESMAADEDKIILPYKDIMTTADDLVEMETEKLSTDAVSKDVENEEEGMLNSMTCGVCFQLLLDPVTLGCGHSFCELCLAHMWKTNDQQVSLCPMCRHPWARPGEHPPSVNVIFKEILEQTYPSKIRERKEAISEDEKSLLRKFATVRTTGLTSTRRNVRRLGVNIPAPRVLICLLVTVFLVAMGVTMVLVSAGIWLFDINDNYMAKPINLWTNEDVIQWMDGLGESVKKDCIEIFEKEKINGPHLSSLVDKSLIQLGVVSEYSRESLLLSINELKQREYAQPRNFMEFKAANREDVVLVTLTYKIFPRLTFLYLYMMHYFDMFLPIIQSQLQIHPDINNDIKIEAPEEMTDIEEDEEEKQKNSLLENFNLLVEPSTKQLMAIGVEILLVPHLVVAAFVISHLQPYPLIYSMGLIHCISATFKEVKALRNKLRNGGGRGGNAILSIFKTSRNSLIGYLILWLLGSTIFYILPSFLLDMIFYFLLVQNFIQVFYSYVLKGCINRFVQFLVALNIRLARGV